MTGKFSVSLALGLLVAGPATVLAQTGKAVTRTVNKADLTSVATPPADAVATRANALTTNMAQALGLTPAQTEKVRAINVTSVRNVETARLRYRQEPGTLRSRIEEVGLARLEQLKDVLTPAQFMRYQQKREEKMGIPTAHGSQGTPPPGLGSRGDDN
jgi:Spy/CpxP family protein refolding chaperone